MEQDSQGATDLVDAPEVSYAIHDVITTNYITVSCLLEPERHHNVITRICLYWQCTLPLQTPPENIMAQSSFRV